LYIFFEEPYLISILFKAANDVKLMLQLLFLSVID